MLAPKQRISVTSPSARLHRFRSIHLFFIGQMFSRSSKSPREFVLKLAPLTISIVNSFFPSVVVCQVYSSSSRNRLCLCDKTRSCVSVNLFGVVTIVDKRIERMLNHLFRFSSALESCFSCYSRKKWLYLVERNIICITYLLSCYRLDFTLSIFCSSY